MFDKIKLKQIDIADIRNDLQLIKDCVEKIDNQDIQFNEKKGNDFFCNSILLFIKDIENILNGKKERIKIR